MNTVFELFNASNQHSPQAPFLCLPPRQGRDYYPDGAQFAYADMLAVATELSARYSNAGYGHGHRVALLLENRPAFFHHYLALNALGVSIVPVNPDYRHDELCYQLAHSDAVLAVAVASRVDDLARAAVGIANPMPVLSADAFPAVLPDASTSARRAGNVPGLESECAMLYTSGTTGRPKGCILTNEYFITAAQCYTSIGGRAEMLAGAERVYNPLPLYHMNALAVTATGMMRMGGCLVLPDRFHPDAWWDDLRATGATAIHYLGVVPPLLLNRAPSPHDLDHTVKFGLGAGVDPAHHSAFEARFGFPLVEVWGMTETGRILADADEPRQVGSRAFGRPARDLEARVVDDDNDDVPEGEPGELVVRCAGAQPRKGFFAGYYKAQTATEEAWRGGWFHTGDTVRMDATGMLYFIDRKKNIIRRSGENIAAAEIEATLQVSSTVAQAAVIGVPDALREEEVFACVVAADAATSEDAALALFDWCAERLAYFKLPGYILYLDALPTTGTNKVQKALLFEPGIDPCGLPGCFDFRARKRRRR